MKSIKTKLIAYFITIILASSIAVGAVAIFRARQALTAEAEIGLENIAKEGVSN